MRNMHRFTHRRAANTFRSRVINCGDKGRDMTPRRTHVQRTASCIHDDARIPPDSCRIFNPTANVTCISKQSRHVLPFFFCSFSFLLFFFSPFCHPRFLSSEDGPILHVIDSTDINVSLPAVRDIFIALLFHVRNNYIYANNYSFF